MNIATTTQHLLAETVATLMGNPRQGWYDTIINTDYPAQAKCLAVILCADANQAGKSVLATVETALADLSTNISITRTIRDHGYRPANKVTPIIGEAT